ncbi:MAG: carboxylating nicotinate-nucleotide diphosphorylase [Candidatus Nanopelagicales bacterium]|jgi:nicotinate-nucleotide pyrophosphorylase (carboxylating)|nr:carboxylating nicotinate-nucleotide diphosphorylase [Candidatus Nanopelagicales bacterium]
MVVEQALVAAGLDVGAVDALIRAALAEDLGDGEDVTSVATVPEGQRATMDLTARAAGVVAGVAVAARVFELGSGGTASVTVLRADGARVERGDVVLTVAGPTRALLVCERTALNLLCHCSGVATATAAWARALAGTGAQVRDTRKTTPGLRALEKYAVRCGGGANHRMGLWDAALVKDNHVVAAGGVAEAFAAVRSRFPGVPVEVEVDSLDQLAEVVDAGADLVLLDNFTPAQTAEAVALVAGRCRLESSGGLSLDVARAYAETGVDYLAVGALTHSAPILDLGADLRPLEG